MKRNDNSRENSRYFTGSEQELQELKTRERLQTLQEQQEIRKRIHGIGRAALLVVLAVVFITVCLAVFFKVRDIEVVGSSRYTESDILAVTGIELGENMFKFSDADLQPLYGRLAYIKEAKLTRKLPNGLVITVTEDRAMYISEIYGELFLLSPELRVLDRVERRYEVRELELIELVLPQVDTAIIGERITFDEETTDKYVTSYVNALAQSPLLSKTTAFDLRDRFDLMLIAEELYLVDLGTGTELPTKLTVVAGMLENEVFSDRMPATIDAENPERCSVIKKADLRIAFEE